MLHTCLLCSKQFVCTYEAHLGISIPIKIDVRALMCMCSCLWWRERLVCTSKRRWSLVLPSDKAGKLLFVIKDPSLTPCYLSSWVLSFALTLLLWVTEERPLKKIVTAKSGHVSWICPGFCLQWIYRSNNHFLDWDWTLSNSDMAFEWKHKTINV